MAIELPPVGGAFRHLLSASAGGCRAYKSAENPSNQSSSRPTRNLLQDTFSRRRWRSMFNLTGSQF